MKIAILTPTFSHFSGIDKVAEQQALEYSKKGNEVTVFCLEADKKPKTYKLEVIGMPKSLLLQRIYRLLFFLDFSKVNHCAAKLQGFDIAISHFYPMNLVASRAKKEFGIKYVYWNHGIGHSELFSPIE